MKVRIKTLEEMRAMPGVVQYDNLEGFIWLLGYEGESAFVDEMERRMPEDRVIETLQEQGYQSWLREWMIDDWMIAEVLDK